ncbi:MAG: hypothetical protein CMI31_11525 [Opitutae bacterium]|nr:hypothetical protein [Opitutae bacterium]
MEPEDVLRRHLEICNEVHNILIEENSWLKKTGELPGQDILGRKEQLLPMLDKSLADLKQLQPEHFSPFGDCKQLVNDSHAKLMQIFYLDRENEDFLQKIAEPPADRAQFTRFAEADEIDEFHGVEDAPGQPEGQSSAEPAPDAPDQDPPLPPADPPGGRLA